MICPVMMVCDQHAVGMIRALLFPPNVLPSPPPTRIGTPLGAVACCLIGLARSFPEPVTAHLSTTAPAMGPGNSGDAAAPFSFKRRELPRERGKGGRGVAVSFENTSRRSQPGPTCTSPARACRRFCFLERAGQLHVALSPRAVTKLPEFLCAFAIGQTILVLRQVTPPVCLCAQVSRGSEP